jgi:cytochrome bd-type quinol oxidase subunit 2
MLLFGWIFRDLGLWLRGRTNARPWWWSCDAAITGGSWTVALSWGWIAASVLGGSVAAATGPGALFGVLAVASLFFLHGLAYGALRLSGELRTRARALSGPSGEVRTYLLTASGMVALGVALGLRLPLLDLAADPGTLGILVPAIAFVLPFLVLSQVLVWVLFRGRVTRPSYL